MYICNHLTSVCNTVHEPDCTRGAGPVTAASVTGTGPGAACKPPKQPPPPPETLPPAHCSVKIQSASGVRIRIGGIVSRRVC